MNDLTQCVLLHGKAIMTAGSHFQYEAQLGDMRLLLVV